MVAKAKKKTAVSKAPKGGAKGKKLAATPATKKASKKSPNTKPKTSVMMAWEVVPSKAKSLIKKAEDLEKLIESKKEEFATTLQDIVNALDGPSSFDHPDKGPTSIMSRGGVWYWRKKPQGGA